MEKSIIQQLKENKTTTGLIKLHKIYTNKTDYDPAYNNAKPKCDKLFSNLEDMTPEQFRDIAIRFANQWHSRTKSDLETSKKIVNKLKGKKHLLDNLNKDLLNSNLDKYGTMIKEIYECFEGINSTATAKIMFMINDKLFPAWDSNIRCGYGILGNKEGYFAFILLSQRELKQLGKKNIDYVQKQTNRSILKVFDEYNYSVYTQGKEKEWLKAIQEEMNHRLKEE